MSTRETRKPRLLGSPTQLRRRRWALAGILLSLLASKVQAEPFGLELRDADGSWRPALAMDTAVAMTITGLLVEVTVTQQYQNSSPHWQEGRYLLPLPSDAAVGRLKLRIGERLIEGEVQEKQQAQRSYQAASAAGRRAALVEQNRPNLFRTAVSNIAPGETVEVEVGYWQPVIYRDGEFSVSLPLTLTPRFQPGGSTDDAPIGAATATPGAVKQALALEPTVSLRAELHAGLPLAGIHSSTHDIDVRAQADRFRIELKKLVEASDRDFELRWTPAPSAEPQRALFTEQIDGEYYAMLLMLPPTLPVDPVPRELILVIDHSGSMHGTSMEQAVAALEVALSRLRPEDRFNLVRFNHHSVAFQSDSVPANADFIAQARAWVRALRADGGTDMAPALSLALATPAVPGYLRQVVLITDAAIGNENQLLERIERERGAARLFTVGIGSAPNDYFVRRAAELGRGSYELVRDINSVMPRMEALLNRIDRPLMSDIEVLWPGDSEAYPTRLPDLYAGEPLQLVGRLPALDGAVRVKGIGRHRLWQDALPLSFGKPASALGVGRLWARAKLDQLHDDLRQGADAEHIRQRSIEVSLQHGLASRYTSLVAVERQPSRPTDSALASTEISNAAPAGSVAMAQGGTSARSQLGGAIALLLLACALLRREPASQPGLA